MLGASMFRHRVFVLWQSLALGRELYLMTECLCRNRVRVKGRRIIIAIVYFMLLHSLARRGVFCRDRGF